MGKDDEDALIKLVLGFFLILIVVAILIIIAVLIIAFLVIAFIGLLTLKSWAYNTKWGRKNQTITSVMFDERSREDFIGPAIIWAFVGILALVPAGIALSLLQATLGVESVFIEPYYPATGFLLLAVLGITIVGPLPIRILKENQWMDDQQTRITNTDSPTTTTQLTERTKINQDDVSIDWSPPISHKPEEKASAIMDVPTPKPTFFLKNEPVICKICKQPIKDNEDITSCPSCKTRFHLKHFAEWIRQKGTCPYCSERIGMKF